LEVIAAEAGGEIDEAVGEGGPGGEEVEGAAPTVLAVEEEGEGEIEEGGSLEAAGFAPIEAGVGDEDGDAADEEGEEGEGVEPVGEADVEGARGHGVVGIIA
jgi:hypothetical protein